MQKKNYFLSSEPPVLPIKLLKKAKKKGVIRLLVVRASSSIPMQSSYEALKAKIAYPILIGEPKKILEEANKLSWKLNDDQIIAAYGEEEAANLAAQVLNKNLESDENPIDAVMKGQLHTDVFMGKLLKKSTGIRSSKKLVHIFAIYSRNSNQEPILISDAAVNVFPDNETFQQSLIQMCMLSKKVDHKNTKIAILSATETPISSVPSSVKAKELELWAKENLQVSVSGPLSIDLAISEEARNIKGIKDNSVAGKANCFLVPDLVSGNILYKSIVYFCGGCAAGVVLGGKIPILLTSRADPLQSRLASIALASIAC